MIVPAFNRAYKIAAAVESVMQQTYPAWELVIVDEGSSDDLAGALSPYRDDARMRLVRHAGNQGIGSAQHGNRGVAR